MNHNYINSGKKQVAQSKEEQEALLKKVATYAKRVDKEIAAEAGFVDFSKPIDE